MELRKLKLQADHLHGSINGNLYNANLLSHNLARRCNIDMYIMATENILPVFCILTDNVNLCALFQITTREFWVAIRHQHELTARFFPVLDHTFCGQSEVTLAFQVQWRSTLQLNRKHCFLSNRWECVGALCLLWSYCYHPPLHMSTMSALDNTQIWYFSYRQCIGVKLINAASWIWFY